MPSSKGEGTVDAVPSTHTKHEGKVPSLRRRWARTRESLLTYYIVDIEELFKDSVRVGVDNSPPSVRNMLDIYP